MMTQPTPTKINIADLTGEAVNSRQVSDLLRDELSEVRSQEVHLDFSNVEFVSRSAAHELLQLQEELRNQKDGSQKIKFVNAPEEVEKMIRIVAANRAAPKNKKRKVNIEKVSADDIFQSA